MRAMPATSFSVNLPVLSAEAKISKISKKVDLWGGSICIYLYMFIFTLCIFEWGQTRIIFCVGGSQLLFQTTPKEPREIRSVGVKHLRRKGIEVGWGPVCRGQVLKTSLWCWFHILSRLCLNYNSMWHDLHMHPRFCNFFPVRCWFGGISQEAEAGGGSLSHRTVLEKTWGTLRSTSFDSFGPKHTIKAKMNSMIMIWSFLNIVLRASRQELFHLLQYVFQSRQINVLIENICWWMW